MTTASSATTPWTLAGSLLWGCIRPFAMRLPRCLLVGLAGALAFGLAATLLVPRSRLGDEWARGLDLIVLAGFGLAGVQVGLVRAASGSAASIKAALQSRCGGIVDALLQSIGWSSDQPAGISDEFREKCRSWLKNPLARGGEASRPSWGGRAVQAFVGRKLQAEYQPVLTLLERAVQKAGNGSADEVRASLQGELVTFLCDGLDRQIRLFRLSGYLLACVLAGVPLLLVALAWILAPSA